MKITSQQRYRKWLAEREMRAFDEMNGESRVLLNWVVDPATGITAEAVKVKHQYMVRNRPHLTVDGVLKLAIKGKVNLR